MYMITHSLISRDILSFAAENPHAIKWNNQGKKRDIPKYYPSKAKIASNKPVDVTKIGISILLYLSFNRHKQYTFNHHKQFSIHDHVYPAQ